VRPGGALDLERGQVGDAGVQRDELAEDDRWWAGETSPDWRRFRSSCGSCPGQGTEPAGTTHIMGCSVTFAIAS
jgi:hypothetical protein